MLDALLMQPSPFPGLGLAPAMAPIMVEAGDKSNYHGNAIVAGLFCIVTCRKYENITQKKS
jgi:hypothetical protein